MRNTGVTELSRPEFSLNLEVMGLIHSIMPESDCLDLLTNFGIKGMSIGFLVRISFVLLIFKLLSLI